MVKNQVNIEYSFFVSEHFKYHPYNTSEIPKCLQEKNNDILFYS